MKTSKCILYSILALCQIGCVSIQRASIIKNKIIVYSTEISDTVTSRDFNNYFIALKNDTIIEVDYPLNFFEKSIAYSKKNVEGDSIETPMVSLIPSYSNLPYVLYRKKKNIYISSSTLGAKSESPVVFYSLSKGDSIKIFDVQNLCTLWPVNSGRSVYTGRDTVIRFYGNKFKCWIFSEYYKRETYGIGCKLRLVYIDKNTFVPLMKIEQPFYDNDFKKPSGTPVISRISFLQEYDPLKFKIKNCK